MLLLFSCWQWGQVGVIVSKAYLAKWLIAQSWEVTLKTGNNTKPWPWADTWPVAKIIFENKKSFYILAGGTGNSLAFGPGHLSNTALPGTYGTSVIGGHRDTHFKLLKEIKNSEKIHIQNSKGITTIYTVQESWIANIKSDELFINPDTDDLYLITCYPFDALASGGDERFIVKAVRQ